MMNIYKKQDKDKIQDIIEYIFDNLSVIEKDGYCTVNYKNNVIGVIDNFGDYKNISSPKSINILDAF